MPKLIEADRLADGLKHHYHPIDQKRESDRQWALGYNAGLDRAIHSITYAPTVDATPVVRCKDCKYLGRCKQRRLCYYAIYGYCSQGVKMDAEEGSDSNAVVD